MAIKSGRSRGTWMGKAFDASDTDGAAVQAGDTNGTTCRRVRHRVGRQALRLRALPDFIGRALWL